VVLVELEITGKRENKLLGREEVQLKTKNAKVTPSRKELRPKIAAMRGAKEELLVIEEIKHLFGERESSIKANVYGSREAMERSAKKHLVKRDFGGKGKEGEGKGEKAEEKEEAEAKADKKDESHKKGEAKKKPEGREKE